MRILLLFSCLVVVLSTECPTLLPPIFPPVKFAGFCTMYGGNCDTSPHQYVDCLNNTKAVVPSFPMPFCPEFSSLSCCDRSQYAAVELNLQQAMNLFGTCPSCYDNFRLLWCSFTCSPDQSVFLDVTNAITGSLGENVVTGVNFAISDQYAQNLWNSCDNVMFGGTGMPVVEILFGASNVMEFLCFQGVPQPAGKSPFSVNFDIRGLHSLSNTSSQHSCDQMVNGPVVTGTCRCEDCPASCPNPCLSSPCQNGGVCELNPFTDGYSCFCPRGYSGTNCQCTLTCYIDARLPSEDCKLDCGEHGRCRFLDDQTPICQCDRQWIGRQCQFQESKFFV